MTLLLNLIYQPENEASVLGKIAGRVSKGSQQIDLCIQLNCIKSYNPCKYLQARQRQPFNID